LTPSSVRPWFGATAALACEAFIADLEDSAQPYLFKLSKTVSVKKLLARQFAHDDWTTPGPSGQGWSAVEDTLKLSTSPHSQ
jgi:hypothetical protein